jgi:hypothetical protein
MSHEYLIEQLQHTGEESISNNSSGKFKLSFNHPVKAIYWVTKIGNYQGGKFMAYHHKDWEKARENAARLLLLSQFDLDESGYFMEIPPEQLGKSDCYASEYDTRYVPFNPIQDELNYIINDTHTHHFFDNDFRIGKLHPDMPLLKRNKDIDLKNKVEGIIRIHMETTINNTQVVFPEVEKITRNHLTIADLSVPISKFDHDNRNRFIKNYDVIVWQHNNYGLYIDGSGNPNSHVELQLNGQPRQSKRSAAWHNLVEPYKHHKNIPQDGINMYSFSLSPGEFQPTGACNFSRIDASQLNLWFQVLADRKMSDVFSDADNKVMIFGLGYNVFRIMSGMGGIAYAN